MWVLRIIVHILEFEQNNYNNENLKETLRFHIYSNYNTRTSKSKLNDPYLRQIYYSQII